MRARRGKDLGKIRHRTEKVGVLHQHGGGLIVDGGLEGLHAAHAPLLTHGSELHVQAGNIGGQHDPPDGVHGFVHHQYAAFGAAHGHHGRLEQRGSAVIDRSVGAVHVHQPAYGRLELKNGLQRALGTFGLVRGVGGVELAAPGQGVHGLGNLVGVVARAQEGNHIRTVFGGEILKIGAHGGLTPPLGQIEPAGTHAGRDVGKQVVQRAHAHHIEHFPQLFRRVGGYTAWLLFAQNGAAQQKAVAPQHMGDKTFCGGETWGGNVPPPHSSPETVAVGAQRRRKPQGKT